MFYTKSVVRFKTSKRFCFSLESSWRLTEGPPVLGASFSSVSVNLSWSRFPVGWMEVRAEKQNRGRSPNKRPSVSRLRAPRTWQRLRLRRTRLWFWTPTPTAVCGEEDGVKPEPAGLNGAERRKRRNENWTFSGGNAVRVQPEVLESVGSDIRNYRAWIKLINPLN